MPTKLLTQIELPADPTVDMEAATKQYVDGLVAGGSISITDEGTSVTPQRSILNFTGAGVRALDNPGNNRTDIIVQGGFFDQWITSSAAPAAFIGSDISTDDMADGSAVTEIYIHNLSYGENWYEDDIKALQFGQWIRIDDSESTFSYIYTVNGAPTVSGQVWTIPVSVWNTRGDIVMPPGLLVNVFFGEAANYISSRYGGLVTGNIWSTERIIVGVDPVEDMDVATKKYVDDNSGGAMKWASDYAPSWNENDVVRSGHWTMIANTYTEDGPGVWDDGPPVSLLGDWSPTVEVGVSTYVDNEWIISAAGHIEHFGCIVLQQNVGLKHRVSLSVNSIGHDGGYEFYPEIAGEHWFTAGVPFTVAVSDAVRVVFEVDGGAGDVYWQSDPGWFTTAPQHCFSATGAVDSGTRTTTAYGCFVQFTPGYVSPDWDVVAYTGNPPIINGGSGGGGLDEATADTRYVNITGDTMTGSLAITGGTGWANGITVGNAPINSTSRTLRFGPNAAPTPNFSNVHDLVAIGYQTLQSLTTGDENVAIGVDALNGVTTGWDNTAVGYRAGYGAVSQYSTYIGAYAGQQDASGYQNTAIGINSGPQGSGLSNVTTIGEQAYATGNQSTVIGSDAYSEGVQGAVLGYGAGTYAAGGIAIGANSYVNSSGTNSVVIGKDVTTNFPNTIVLGKNTYNVSVPGTLTLGSNPTADFQAATKLYVDNQTSNVVTPLDYSFNLTTTPPPGAGQIRLNNATQPSATTMYVHYDTAPGADVKLIWTKTVVIGDTIVLQDKDDSSKWQRYTVAATPTDNTTYCTITVAWVDGGTALTAARTLVFLKSPGGLSQTTADTRYVNIDGDTMTGMLTLFAAPSNDLHAATKKYADDKTTTHEAAADPHTGYQLESEKAAVNGYASLDGTTKVPIAQVPTGTTSTTVSLGNHNHDTAYVSKTTSDTMAGQLTLNSGGLDLLLKPGSADHAFIGLYARTASPTTRTAYIGFGAAASDQFTIKNEITDADIRFSLTGTAGNIMLPKDPTANFAASTKQYVDAVKSGSWGWVNHGSTAGTARPTGYGAIQWIGTVAPTNAATGDVWVDAT